MKKIIYFLGIVFLSSIIILNLKYTAFLDNSEHIIFYNNSWLFNLGIVLVVIAINYIANIINKKLNKKERSFQKNSYNSIINIFISKYPLGYFCKSKSGW